MRDINIEKKSGGGTTFLDGKSICLSGVKSFLRVDFDDDDDYIRLLIQAAKDYIKDAVGVFNSNNPRHKLLLMALISTLYNNRRYTVDTSDETVMYLISSMVLQLQLGDSDNG